MKFLNIVGTRPNFMKIAPFQRELVRKDFEYTLVHTGQHYDRKMSESFFEDLDIAPPAINLGVGSGTHAYQTAEVMEKLDPVVDEEEPDWVVVVGDVNSTLASALITSKKMPRLAHIEAGIRSGDRSMPEEVNRVVVDQLADALFCFDDESVENLEQEGRSDDHIHLVGDIMIDSLQYVLESQRSSKYLSELPEEFALLTLHRPQNVDQRASLDRAYRILKQVHDTYPVVFPVHPRTRERLEAFDLLEKWKETFRVIPPLGYRAFVQMMDHASVVLTDSGSIQQETSVLEVPCLTLRDTTERPITIRKGTNQLVGLNQQDILDSIDRIQSNAWKKAEEIPLWDGNTASRIMDVFENLSRT